MLSASLIMALQLHLEKVKVLHAQDFAERFDDVYLPFALAQKYPNAGRKWGVSNMSSQRASAPLIPISARSTVTILMSRRYSVP